MTMTMMMMTVRNNVSEREGKLNVSPSVLRGSVLRDLHRVARVHVSGVHVRFESRRQKE